MKEYKGGIKMKTITVDGVKYIKESDIAKTKIIHPIGDKSNPYMEVGKSYFLRTVTHYFTGRLLWVGEKEMAFNSVCWIADTGRFHKFIAENALNESEPFPTEKIVIVGRGALIDMSEHELVLTVK